jgi:2,4-dienoyl-CoA reductase-like NADH-dependent reductase (Old Yellow Enzyme family)
MKLLSPIPSLGLSHRVVMSPLTRVRGTDRFACGSGAAQYYSERATPGGLIITEGSPVSPETQYEYAAGCYTPEQTASWKTVVEAVHAKKGKISIQLWHLGRMAHGSWAEHPFLKSLGRPLPSVSCSPTTPSGASRNVKGERGSPYPQARELTAQEIRTRLVEDFVQAARNAKAAG